MTQPELLVLDTPMRHLDARVRDEVADDLRRVHGETGLTMLILSEDPAEALALADRLAVMDLGRIIQSGTPQELYNRPIDVFVARLLGPTNLLQGQVESHVVDPANEVVGAHPARSFDRPDSAWGDHARIAGHDLGASRDALARTDDAGGLESISGNCRADRFPRRPPPHPRPRTGRLACDGLGPPKPVAGRSRGPESHAVSRPRARCRPARQVRRGGAGVKIVSVARRRRKHDLRSLLTRRGAIRG